MSSDKALQIVENVIQMVNDSIDDEKKKVDASTHEQYVLGLDSSTQSLTVSIFDISPKANFQRIATQNINFDAELGEKYRVKNGVIQNIETEEVTAPTLMFIEALDIALDRLQSNDHIDFSQIVAVSGSGQQHGSVYWKKNALQTLQHLNPKQSLLANLKSCFAIQCGPIWMDSSTTKQCRDLELKIGSAHKVAQISGSRAYERFTGYFNVQNDCISV